MTDSTALVLFSGGQDSTTCLAWALDRFDRVETVGFFYGQRHAVELETRPRILERLKRDFPAWGARLGEDRMLTLNLLAEIGGTALTAETEIAMGKSGLPNTFVPGRNLLFFTTAAAVAYRILSAACAKPTIPAIRIAATIRSKAFRWPSISAWRPASWSIRR